MRGLHGENQENHRLESRAGDRLDKRSGDRSGSRSEKRLANQSDDRWQQRYPESRSVPDQALRLKLAWEDRYFFTEQMAILLDAGVAIVPALALLILNAKGYRLKRFLQMLEAGVTRGQSISSILQRFPRAFSQLYIAMIRIGEESGKLPVVFNYLAELEARRQAARKSIRKAMLYPMMVLIVAFAVLAFVMIVVVPTFEVLYRSGGMELPAMTQKVMAISHFVSGQQGFYLISGLLAVFLFLRSVYRKSWSIGFRVDRMLLKMPFAGVIVRHDFNARYCDIIAMMLSAGVPLVEALLYFEKSVTNRYLQIVLQRMYQSLMRGESLYIVSKASGVFTEVALTLISVGEMSGKLESTLEKSAQYHRELVERRISTLIALIDPLSLVLIGGLVGVILIALYLPMFSMGRAI